MLEYQLLPSYGLIMARLAGWVKDICFTGGRWEGEQREVELLESESRVMCSDSRVCRGKLSCQSDLEN